MLLIVPPDVLEYVYGFMDTVDLARLDVVSRVPEHAWTVAVQRRCGPLWPGGRAGAVRLYRAVHCMPPCTVYGASYICAGARAASAIGTRGIHTWGAPDLVHTHSRYAYCACMVGDAELAVGDESGLYLVRQGICVWNGAVLSVACVRDGSIWFCTPDQRAYAYQDGIVSDLACSYATCVSGPWGMVGTQYGTYPVPSIRMPCCRIEQSATLAAAWFSDGSVCTFKHGQLLHTFAAAGGMQIMMPSFSVIGDVVCINGAAWRDGQLYRQCPGTDRACTADGQLVVVKLAVGEVGLLT